MVLDSAFPTPDKCSRLVVLDSAQAPTDVPRILSSTRNAFAAGLDDGTVVTRGDPYIGADSSQVREQLVRVHADFINSLRFCCHPG